MVKTHFGFEQVDEDEKASRVGQVFDSVADNYDIMNDVMSLGLHRIWKRITVLTGGFREGQKVLDLAGGTGDLSALIAPRVGKTGQVVLSDINASMLLNGRNNLLDKGLASNLDFVQANAETLPFPDNYFDRVIMGFGLRNVTRKEEALASIHRVLKPGGSLLVLEFSSIHPVLKKAYDFYSFNLLPKMGSLIARDEDSYRYLAESIRMHPDQETLKSMMEEAGFTRCDYHNMTAGIVAVHRGWKS